jgi:hypothetical protein
MPKETLLPERRRTAEQPKGEPVKGKQVLSDALAEQRQRTEDAWFAATTEMQNDAWTAGRDKDRRVRTEHHEPERRCR